MQKFISKSFLLLAYVLLSTQNIYAAGSENYSPVPVVTIGGFVNSSSSFRNQDSTFRKDRLPDAELTIDPDTDQKSIDEQTGTHNKMNNNPDFTNEAEVHIKVAGINEFGMKYGAIIELEANTSNSARNQGVNADKAYIFTESRMGKMEFGNNSAVNSKMRVGPATFARGAGGINGKYLEYINMPMLADSTQVLANGGTNIGNCDGYRVDTATGVVTQTGGDCGKIKLPRFILIPQSPISHGGYAKGFYNRSIDNDYTSNSNEESYGFNKNSSVIRDGSFGDLEDASKISYYTPRISGWQLGASFTPDTGNNGTSASISGNNSGDIKQAISYGINYSDNFENLGFAISATGEAGKYEQTTTAETKRKNLQAYDIGMMITYAGATIGGSYGNWGSSLQPKNGIYSCDYNIKTPIFGQNCENNTPTKKNFGDATYYTAGLAYQFGPLAASITYLNSNFQENRYNATSFGIDYKMAKGLMPYLEVTKYQFQSNQPKYLNGFVEIDESTISNNKRQLKDNQGYVGLLGLLFAF